MQNIETIRPTDEAISAEFSPQRQEAIFQEILRTGSAAAPATPHGRRWIGIGAAAVAGVIVIALAAQALTAGPKPVVVPVNGETATAEPSGKISPTTAASRNAASAAAMLAVVAQTAASAPAAEPNTFLHVSGFGEQIGVQLDDGTEDPDALQYRSEGYDTYIDSDGWMWSMRVGDDNYWLLAPQDNDGFIDSLPAEPVALEATLRALEGNNSADERVFKAINEILITETAPAELRAAAILVLQRIAENPQTPETTKDGELASPEVTVVEIPQGYRVSILDPTSRPGIEYWLVLDETGQIAESGSSGPDGTYTSSVELREQVTSLPDDFVEALGTDQVEKLIQR